MEQELECGSAIAQTNQRIMDAFQSRRFDAIADCYTDDAMVLVAKAPAVVGRTSIQSAFSFLGKRVQKLELLTAGIDVQDHVAFEDGTYRHLSSNGEVLDQGKYLVCWTQVGLIWKIHRDVLVSDA